MLLSSILLGDQCRNTCPVAVREAAKVCDNAATTAPHACDQITKQTNTSDRAAACTLHNTMAQQPNPEAVINTLIHTFSADAATRKAACLLYTSPSPRDA